MRLCVDRLHISDYSKVLNKSAFVVPAKLMCLLADTEVVRQMTIVPFKAGSLSFGSSKIDVSGWCTKTGDLLSQFVVKVSVNVAGPYTYLVR